MIARACGLIKVLFCINLENTRFRAFIILLFLARINYDFCSLPARLGVK